MRWLIVEDSLESRRGHWFEYLGGFCRELSRLGHEVSVLASCNVEPFIIEQIAAMPVLPASVFLKMSDDAGRLRRYARVPLHAWKTRRSIARWLRRNTLPDLIFVPTVLVHHLLGWTWLIKRFLHRSHTRVLLFFPNTPIMASSITGKVEWIPSPTSSLFARLVHALRGEVQSGRVILGVETFAMRDALTKLTGVPFTYLPHPVPPLSLPSKMTHNSSSFLTFACFGPARHEKGSNLLVSAIERHLSAFPQSRIKFVIQWIGDFTTPEGEIARLPEGLRHHPQVEVISRYFADGEYARRLADTSALLLPYRQSSYALRVSRVVIEALVHAKPVVATKGTTLYDQTLEYGAGVGCEDGDVDSIVRAIHEMEQRYGELAEIAKARTAIAQHHFSVLNVLEYLDNQDITCAVASQ